MANIRWSRNTLAAAFTTLLLSGLAIAPASAIVKTQLGLIDALRNPGCEPHGNSAFPALIISPEGTIPAPDPVGVPLNTD